MNKMTFATIAFMSTLSIGANADIVYLCEHSGLERKISVVYENEGIAVPCAVTYEKAEGVQTLWTAEADEGYCEEKASAFVEKQQGWGWQCGQEQDQVASEPAVESEPPVAVDSTIEQAESVPAE